MHIFAICATPEHCVFVKFYVWKLCHFGSSEVYPCINLRISSPQKAGVCFCVEHGLRFGWSEPREQKNVVTRAQVRAQIWKHPEKYNVPKSNFASFKCFKKQVGPNPQSLSYRFSASKKHRWTSPSELKRDLHCKLLLFDVAHWLPGKAVSQETSRILGTKHVVQL